MRTLTGAKVGRNWKWIPPPRAVISDSKNFVSSLKGDQSGKLYEKYKKLYHGDLKILVEKYS
jgi:hypothetical protein